MSRFYFTLTDFLTASTKTLEGLNAGMLCAGILIVVFLEMLRPCFLCPAFDDKAAEATEINVLPTLQRFLYAFHKGLYNSLSFSLLYSFCLEMLDTISAFVIFWFIID